MASNAISGVGTKFQRESDVSSGEYDDIAEINPISGPTMSRSTIDVTSLDSTGGYREFIAGLRDPGGVTLSMNFTRDGYIVMKDDFESDSLVSYRIVLPDAGATTFDFEGLVTDLPLDIPADDKVSCSITIKISGQVTVTS